jgi:hypothetical protein
MATCDMHRMATRMKNCWFILRTKIDIAWLVTMCAVVFFCAPFLFGGRVLFWGVPLLQFYPWRLEALRAISAGYLPLWNPDLGMGAPLLANAQSALLYPPNLLLFLIPMPVAQNILLSAHLVLAGWGMSRLVRELSIGMLGQIVAGLAFAFCGYVVARAWFFSINAAVAWLPWILLAGERLVRQTGFKRAVWLALAIAMQWLAGHWQTAWYTAGMLAFWMTVRAAQVSSSFHIALWKRIVIAWKWAALAVLLAVGLTAAQLFPTAEYWLNSQRVSGVDPALAVNFSFWPWRLLELVAPGFFGSPAHGNFHAFGNYWEDAVYIGILPLALAFAALLLRFRRKGILGFPYGICLTAIVVAFPLAMGPWLPWLANVSRWIPGWNIFQAPTRITIWAEVGLILLAAAGVDHWQRAAAGDSRWLARFGVGALGLVLIGLVAPMFSPIPATFAHAFAITGGFLFLGVCLWRIKPWAESGVLPKWAWPACVVFVVAVDLLMADFGLLPAGPAELYTAPNPGAAELEASLQGGRIYMPESIRETQTYSRFIRFDTFFATANWMEMRTLELPNVNVMDAIPSANNFDPFVPARYADFLIAVEQLPPDSRSRLWKMMNLGGVWQGGSVDSAPILIPVADRLGRAWGVCAAEWAVGPQDSLTAILNSSFDPASQVILETGKGAEGGACTAAPKVDVDSSRDPNRIVAHAKFNEPGFLVLSDVNYPGWEATVDGEMVPLLQADYLFRAVRVPAGTHTIVFVYQPLSFWAGALISLIAWLGVFVLALVAFCNRDRTAAAEIKNW